jgi:hypothetical protein
MPEIAWPFCGVNPSDRMMGTETQIRVSAFRWFDAVFDLQAFSADYFFLTKNSHSANLRLERTVSWNGFAVGT